MVRSSPRIDPPWPVAAPTRRLRVVQMTDVIGRGGAEKALVDLALRLNRTRYDVQVCATRSAGNYQPLLDGAGVPTHILDRRSRADLGKLGGLAAWLRRERIDILHTHLFGSNTWGRLLGRLAGVPILIAHEHWSSKTSTEVTVDRLLARLSDRILVPSAWSRELVHQSDGVPLGQISVVYNGVDTGEFAPRHDGPAVRAALGIPSDAPLIGYVGRLAVNKGGQDDLLRAVAALRGDLPGVHLLIIGDGALRPSLTALAAELGLSDVVHFTGVRADVAWLLGAADVFALPSRFEALPIAVLEAMALARPVVATRVGGVPEAVLAEQTGLLVPPGAVEALRAALARVLGDPALAARLGAAGRDRLLAHFTLDQMVRRVEQIYEALARRKLLTRGQESGIGDPETTDDRR